MTNNILVAWTYELSSYRDAASGKYYGWKRYLSFDKPCVPEESIRNLTPLYKVQE